MTPTRTKGISDDLLSLLRDWPAVTRSMAYAFHERHGPPDEARQDALTWRSKGGWKRIVLHREAVEHRWPTPHEDACEHVLDHAVPPERASSVMNFHGGIVMDRARGEVSVRCADEPANILAANLAHELLEGALTTHHARRAFEQRFASRHDARDDDYVARLLFGRQVNTRDPDEPQEQALPRPQRSRTTPPRFPSRGEGVANGPSNEA